MAPSSVWVPKDPLDKDIFKGFAEHDTLSWNDIPVQLKSGNFSHVYVSARGEITADPVLRYPIGERIARTIQNVHDFDGDTRCPVLIGIPTAGTLLACVASDASLRERITLGGKPFHVLQMREMRKLHGRDNRWVDGPPPDFSKFSYWLIDNTVTDGGTKREVLARLEEDGYLAEELSALVLIDRQQGGLEAMQAMGLRRVIAVYSVLEIASAFDEMGLWTRQRVKDVEEDISGSKAV